MNYLRRLLGMCLIVSASAGLIVACGTTEEEACDFDVDCADGEICLQPPGDDARCVTDCTADATLCGAGEVCTSRYGGGETQACVSDNILCAEAVDCPGDLVCGASGFCEEAGANECADDLDCADGEVCDAGICVMDEPTTCEIKADCDLGEICGEAGTCVPGCEDTLDCPQDEVCDAGMCVASCIDNSDCADDAVCNSETGFCEVIASATYFFLEITDTTDPTSDACTAPSDNDPGSDIMTAEMIIDGQDAGIWARAVNWIPIDTDESGNDNLLAGLPIHMTDGTAPSYSIDEGVCPESFSDDEALISLGCGGKVWVEFRDADDARVEIPTDGTATIYVYEFGSPLCGSDTSDTYSVELCEVSESDIAGAFEVGDVDCQGSAIIPEGQGRGVAEDIVVE